MRRTKAEAEQTRQMILDTALEVFSRQGYAGATLDDIARAAEVTRGALYWHFAGGKPDIYQALLQERQAPAMAVIQETLAADLPPLARLRQLLVRSLELLDTDPGYRGIIALLIRAEPGPESAQGMGAKTAGMGQLHATLTDLIRAGIADGSVYPEVDPELAAFAAVGLLNGAILTWLLVPETFRPQAQASALVDLFLRSLVQAPRTEN